MIKFEFTVTDADAENILGCIQNQIGNNHVAIQELMVKGNQEDDIERIRLDCDYLADLKKKMLNKVVTKETVTRGL